MFIRYDSFVFLDIDNNLKIIMTLLCLPLNEFELFKYDAFNA